MATLKYQDRTLDVLTKDELLASLLYAEGYDAKNKVNTSDKFDLVRIGASQTRDFVTEFYEIHGEAPDMIIIDLGNECYIPTYFSCWKIEQYRDLSGAPYLGLKKSPIDHFIYYFPEPSTEPSVPTEWADKEITKPNSVEKVAGYDFDDYGSWALFMGDYNGRYLDCQQEDEIESEDDNTDCD